MTKQLKLKIVTPERLILEELVDQVTLPTTEGEITILPDHVPLITGLTSGDVIAKTKGEDVPMAVAGGFVEVHNVSLQNDDKVTEVAVLADFAEHVQELSEEKIAEGSTPMGAVVGKNSSGENSYGPPCPPSGAHRYYFRLYALDTPLNLSSNSNSDDLRGAMEGHVLAEAELMGRYQRK